MKLQIAVFFRGRLKATRRKQMLVAESMRIPPIALSAESPEARRRQEMTAIIKAEPEQGRYAPGEIKYQ